MKRYMLLILLCFLCAGCTWDKAIKISELINKKVTFRTYEYYNFPDAPYWFFDIDNNKRVYGPHNSLIKVDDNGKYILFAIDDFGYYKEITDEITNGNINESLLPLFLFMSWAGEDLAQRNSQKEYLDNKYKLMGLSYVVVNETGTNEPLLTFKDGKLFGPGGNAYTKESVAAMIQKAIKWKGD